MTRITAIVFFIFGWAASLISVHAEDVKKAIQAEIIHADSARFLAASTDRKQMICYDITLAKPGGIKRDFIDYLAKCEFEHIPYPDLSASIATNSHFSLQLWHDGQITCTVSYLGGYLFFTRTERCFIMTSPGETDVESAFVKMLEKRLGQEVTKKVLGSAQDPKIQEDFHKPTVPRSGPKS